MSFNRIVLTGLTALAGLGMTSDAFAGGRNPGSLLLFPEFDNRDGVVTVLTVTNTNDDFAPAEGNPLQFAGTVRVEFKYIGAFDNSYNPINCEEFNREAVLTPNDTLTLITNAHNPQHEQGYVYVFAKSMAGEKIAFNWLIGNVLTVDGYSAFEYSINPVVFDGIGDGTLTDLDGDGICDLDGTEYSEVPDEILIPRFLGQGGAYDSELIFVGLSGGAAFTTTVDFLIYNDNEEVFSSEYTFDCWSRVHLLQISGIFDNHFLQNFTNDNPAELLGAPLIETGWMRIDGALADSTVVSIDDPAFYAVLVERIGNRGAADLPFEAGLQDNGDLLPRSIMGDM
jgi:hypothetical protein